VQFSLLYKQFFAGELEVLCSMPEFWQRVSILYAGGSDFALFGSWDALVLLGREVQRLFHRFNEENLKDIPGGEGKTISMALSIAQEGEFGLAQVYRDARRRLDLAKAGGKDCFHVFGHTVEWRQLSQAAGLQDNLGRLVQEFGGSPQLLGDLIRFYKGAGSVRGSKAARVARPWRYHRRLSLVAAGARDREYQNLRTKLVVELIGKNAAQARLRPGGRVALEWARLMSEA
jgi:CRISPR-associated protein Csm1